MNLKDILGGTTEIHHNTNAWTLRISTAPFIDAEKQPVLYAALKRIADKEGLTVEDYQHKTGNEFL